MDWADVNLLKRVALLEIFIPKPQLVITLSLSLKYSKANGPDWYLFEKFFFGDEPASKK